MNKNYLIPFIFIISLLSSCQKQKSIQSEDNELFLNINELGEYNQRGNILLEAIFDECGEWGGHSEKIRIYVDSSMIAHARYMAYPFNCDSIEYYHDIKHIKPRFDTTIILDNQKQKSIITYMSRLIQAKMTEKFPGHAGQTFAVSKSDSTLIIQVYDSKQKNINSYNQLLSELL